MIHGVKQQGAADAHVVFIGNARCFHTMDWYRNAQAMFAPLQVPFATDLIESEGHIRLVRQTDSIINIYNIDWLLLPEQSNLANAWRNFVKTAVVPVQLWKIRQLAKARSHQANLIFHAHSMYYMWICWLAGVNYVGTPQGSEILVRPKRSKLYRFFAAKALSAAKAVTVDSINMRDRVFDLCGKEAIIIQNGIDVSAILEAIHGSSERMGALSIRGLYPNYRIDKILSGRSRASSNMPLTFIYPSWEEAYKKDCFRHLMSGDRDLGRLSRLAMYELLQGTLLVLSIPESDSSPRSVYEAIFCGCCVAIVHNPWIEVLPECMKARLHLVDLNEHDWFQKAVDRAHIVTAVPYTPSEAAMELFDQKRSLAKLAKRCYDI